MCQFGEQKESAGKALTFLSLKRLIQNPNMVLSFAGPSVGMA